MCILPHLENKLKYYQRVVIQVYYFHLKKTEINKRPKHDKHLQTGFISQEVKSQSRIKFPNDCQTYESVNLYLG